MYQWFQGGDNLHPQASVGHINLIFIQMKFQGCMRFNHIRSKAKRSFQWEKTLQLILIKTIDGNAVLS